MAIDIKAPTFPESIADGTVATWHKKPGEAVKRDDLLVDIETDKVVMEVLAEADGVLAAANCLVVWVKALVLQLLPRRLQPRNLRPQQKKHRFCLRPPESWRMRAALIPPA